MKLRRIQLVGFKSFKDKVTVELSDDLNGIVGPNGCGKSNVVDALKWAMGDMSPKSLRGSSLSDVIFAGSENHQPAGMAEVTLTFENESASPDDESTDDGDAAPVWNDSVPREYRQMPEISITRRLHRSGESDYLINDVDCRLMDIRSLLAGTGLGKQGYSIIEQGEIAFVVSAKPSERRLIIEEASGITRYKSQRDRAQRKLERTEQNLQRIRDVVSEVSKRLESLERQARRAERFQERSRELERLQIAAVVGQRARLAARASKLRAKLQEGRVGAEKARKSLSKLEEKLEDKKMAAFQAEKNHAELTEQFYKLDTRLNLAQSNREHLADSVEDARARHAEALSDRDRQIDRKRKLAAEIERVDTELADFAQSPDQARARIKEAQEALESLKSRLGRAEQARDQARDELEDTRAKRRRLDDRGEWLASQQEELERRRDETASNIEAVTDEVEDLRRAINRLKLDIERSREELEARRERRRQAKGALAEHREHLAESKDQLEEVRAERIEVAARIDSLEEMRRRGDGYAQGVQRVLEWAHDDRGNSQRREDVLGPVGDFLDVSKGSEAAVAAFLGARLGDLVVTRRRAALDALGMLDAEQVGRAGFYVLDDPDGDPEQAIDAWLEDLEVVDSLADVQPPDTHESATRAWATTAGDIEFASGRVVGGHLGDQAETVLRQARELKELRGQFDQLVARESQARQDFQAAQENVARAEEHLGEARDAVEESSLEARRIEQERDSETRELERTEKRLRRMNAEVEPIDDRLDELQREAADLAQNKADIDQQLPQLEDTLAECADRFSTLQAQVEDRQAAVTDKKVALAESNERRKNLEHTSRRLAGSLEAADGQIERLAGEANEQAARLEEFEAKSESNSAEVDQLEADYKEAKQAAEAARGGLDEVNDAVRDLEVEIVERRQAVEKQAGGVQEYEMNLREVGVEIEHVDRDLRERFEMGLPRARRVAEEVDGDAESRDDRIATLQRKIDNMGAVNQMAVDEFDEALERKAFLENQQLDLEASVDDLHRAIKRMDRESRKRFQETFDAVNDKFQEFFPRLFQGGHARLTLTDPDDVLESGVDIEVSPPGKRLQNVSLLSGGEKALTAVSLIFAIFSLKPTPFSVLDEVDAPLDEANVGRFAAIVRELSQQSQMILITHNRRTMESCETLYGVTMEEPGVSKIVSVRLHEIDDRLAS